MAVNQRVNRNPQFNATPNTMVVEGSFCPNNTSAVDQATIRGKGIASVARSAAGKFTVTFVQPYLTLQDYDCNVATAADNVDLYAQGGAFTAGTDSTAASWVIKLKTGATNTDVAADADTRVHFRCTFPI